MTVDAVRADCYAEMVAIRGRSDADPTWRYQRTIARALRLAYRREMRLYLLRDAGARE